MSEGELTSTDFQYVTDTKGEMTGVLLSPKAFEAFEEYMIDKAMIEAAQESKNEPTRPFSEFVEELRATGELDV